MAREPVLTLTDRGLYCAAGDFFVDPWRSVPRAVITHAHADHARPGHGRLLATDLAAPVLRHRLGSPAIDTVAYGERRRIGGAEVSLHPAGHVPGSAQVRIEVGGEVWVVSGDYKLQDDGLSTPFEPLRCHTFVSECTFGLPVFAWAPQAQVLDAIRDWVAASVAQGRTPVLGVYALGKAQRLLAGLADLAPVLTHGAVEGVTQVMRAQGIALPATVPVTGAAVTGAASGGDPDRAGHAGRLVLAPPSALAGPWLRRFGPVSTAVASGWMRLRGVRRRRGADRGFVVSDHADWAGLNAAIAATGAERVFVTHGYTAVFRRWLAAQGLDAHVLAADYGGDEAEARPGEDAEASAGEGGEGRAAPGSLPPAADGAAADGSDASGAGAGGGAGGPPPGAPSADGAR